MNVKLEAETVHIYITSANVIPFSSRVLKKRYNQPQTAFELHSNDSISFKI